MKKCIWIIALFIATSVNLNAQTISGKVIDAKTFEPLPFANVFLNKTTIGTTSNESGEFVLKNTPIGSYELIVSFVGYESRKLKINLRNADFILGVVGVMPSVVELNNVEVTATRDKAWEKQLKKFNSIFLGKGKFASSCKIINPWVINFSTDVDRKFVAEANEPIEILNESLGYKIFYYLSDFRSDVGGEAYSISGNIRFEEMEASDENQKAIWSNHRKEVYKKSYNYFFRTVLLDSYEGEGFKIYQQHIDRDSKNFGIVKLSNFETKGIVSPSDKEGEFTVAMKGTFEIRNSKRKERSLLEIKNDFVRINKQGFVLNSTDIVVSGTYYKNRLASLLPISYHYQEEELISDVSEKFFGDELYEKVYIHNDKPYYYPGESLWFKGYINFSESALRDSLSRTIYTEFISPDKKLILSKIVEIDSGFFHNDFILPDTLKEGTYYLRAYTNLCRNFGDSTLFVKSIPLISITDKVNPDQGVLLSSQDSLFTITSDKEIYKLREKIVLRLSTKNEAGPITSNLSLSVTDVIQVVPITGPVTIMNTYPRTIESNGIAIELKYPVEHGIGFTARFFNDKGEGEKALLNVIQINPQKLMQIETSETGTFRVNDLQFYDSTTFAVKAVREKDTAYGKIKILENEIVPMLFKTQNFNLNILKAGLPQRTNSEYVLPKDSRLLETVVVKGKRIEEFKPYSQDAWSGRIIKGSDLNKTNLLFTLKNTPGVSVNMVTGIVRSTRGMMRLGSQQAAGQGPDSGPPYSLSIDGLQIQGPDAGYTGQRLGALDPANIEIMYVGRNHIAVFMKRPEDIKITPNFQTLKIQGYSSARSFNHPDYSNPKTDTTKADYRSTIYWNPDVVTDAKTGTAIVSFFAADLPGKYRVVAEGVTQHGDPVRCVYFFEVDNE